MDELEVLGLIDVMKVAQTAGSVFCIISFNHSQMERHCPQPVVGHPREKEKQRLRQSDDIILKPEI